MFFFFPNWWEIIAAEIERFSAMFQEKKQEVQTAILRVDRSEVTFHLGMMLEILF